MALLTTKKTETVAQPSGFDNAKLYVWVKGLESKVNNLLRELDVLKNDFIQRSNNLKKEMRAINEDFIEVKHRQEKMDQKIDLIIKELRKTAGIEEVTAIKKYIEFWNPMNFVTQRDLERAIENKINLIHKNSNKVQERNKKDKEKN